MNIATICTPFFEAISKPVSFRELVRCVGVMLFGVLLLMPGMAAAQSTFGSVRGIAQDDAGGALPDAQVTLHNVGENSDRTGVAGPDGGFVLENVKAGQYTLRAK